jgi:hypothetical protein
VPGLRKRARRVAAPLTDLLAAAILAANPRGRVAMGKRYSSAMAVTRLFRISGICPEAGQAASWSRTTLVGARR